MAAQHNKILLLPPTIEVVITITKVWKWQTILISFLAPGSALHTANVHQRPYGFYHTWSPCWHTATTGSTNRVTYEYQYDVYTPGNYTLKVLYMLSRVCFKIMVLGCFKTYSSPLCNVVCLSSFKATIKATTNLSVRAHVFPRQLSKFTRFGWPERENWAALIHRQAHSGHRQFLELVRFI